jgi:hypothetical protein
VGWELHITRADDWLGSEASPISEAEWFAYIATDSRIRRFGTSSVATWNAEDGPSMSWSGGQINVKGVRSEAEIGEIAAVAAGLGASLQGDDGETYDLFGRPFG